MRATTSGDAFAAASAAMIRGVDSASTVHVLLSDCLGLLGADTAGVLVGVGDQGLELLVATSHKSLELELYQVQLSAGPCVETIETGQSIEESGRNRLEDRWPDFGRAMVAAGLETVLASPMHWHDRAFGGLNLFWRSPKVLTQDERELAQAFADISTLALMQSPGGDDTSAVADKLRVALQGRVVIERAKGALAHTEELGMDEAFARLVKVSDETGRSLAEVAQSILDEVVTRPG